MTNSALYAPPRQPLVWRLVWRHVLPDKRERLRLTFAGWIVVLVILGLAWGAYSNSSNIIFLALSLTLAMTMLSGLLSWSNFRKLTWRFEPPPALRAGEIAPVRVILTNGRTRLPAFSIRFLAGCERDKAAATLRFPGPVEAGGSAERFWEFLPAKRGRRELRLSGATSAYPFAMLEKMTGKITRTGVLVRPARIAYRLDYPDGRLMHREGDLHRKGSGAELVGLREYREGDPVRLIHWKVSAKRGRPVVRETAEPGEPAWSLRLDPSDFMGATDAAFEKACSLAGTLAEDLFHKDRLVALAAGAAPFTPVKRPAEVQAFLDDLATLERPSSPVARGVRRADTLFIVPGPGDVVHVVHRENIVGEA